MPEIHSRIARRRVRFRSAAAAAAALALAATALAACGDAGATITRLTVGTPGPDPYTLVANTDKTGVKPRPQAGGKKTGDSPGLYGGTRQASTCDQQKLVAFLQANPEKAKAWAEVQGIPVSDIPRYVSRLTPVLLRTDTLVTNHGYHEGKAVSAPAVLQAGMGVLINGYGVPTVKCNCGNPLTRPKEKISSGNVSYTGRSWPGFKKRNVTEIQPRDSRKGTIETFVLVDPEATMGFERPRATEGESDGPPTELPTTETEVPTSDSPAPSDSGLDSPGVESPGPESPGTESPGTETPSPEVSPGSPGVPTEDPGTGGGDPGTGGGIEQPGEPTQGPMSLPPSEEPAPTVS
ncbi:DUF6777 domain-containing protein [Actinomadura chibensis]|uniref:DUF6777 domain-containing protein n=1 Tax=Actinomadura chibensis TaxID=392828 RepID=A0A5D0NEK2_9ACTN|nr:DUF6777 domain-containing protein [Actinomadura chibensis]TYB42763.1 hypothetical protein FXF69_28700 [Actinomadura chibensis]